MPAPSVVAARLRLTYSWGPKPPFSDPPFPAAFILHSMSPHSQQHGDGLEACDTAALDMMDQEAGLGRRAAAMQMAPVSLSCCQVVVLSQGCWAMENFLRLLAPPLPWTLS